MRTKYRLMTPGPAPIPPEVAAAAVLPLVHEHTPVFAELFAGVARDLQHVMGTANDVLLFAASGTGALEAAIQNLFSAGDRVLVASNGFFGDRLAAMCRAYGLDVAVLHGEWGRALDVEAVAAAVAADPAIGAVACVLSETSTGAVSDVRGLESAAGPALTIVDAMSAVGACELRADEWGLDVVIGGSAKALMGPPGVAFVSVSPRAWRRHRTARLPRYYFDWTTAREAAAGDVPRTSWTPPVSLLAQLAVALRQIRAEGLPDVLRRHVLLGRGARAGLRGMGLRLLAGDEDRNAAVTAAWTPGGVDGRELARTLVVEHGIQVAGGLGALEGRIVRIGHCGHFDLYDIVTAVAGLELALDALGHPVELGSGVRE